MLMIRVNVTLQTSKSTFVYGEIIKMHAIHECNHRRTRRGAGRAAAPHGLKKFRVNSVFKASASCSKTLNEKKYFNTVKYFRAKLL